MIEEIAATNLLYLYTSIAKNKTKTKIKLNNLTKSKGRCRKSKFMPHSTYSSSPTLQTCTQTIQHPLYKSLIVMAPSSPVSLPLLAIVFSLL